MLVGVRLFYTSDLFGFSLVEFFFFQTPRASGGAAAVLGFAPFQFLLQKHALLQTAAPNVRLPSKSRRSSGLAVARENTLKKKKSQKEQPHPGCFSSRRASSSRIAGTRSLAEVLLITCSLKLFSWQKLVSALRAKYIHSS